MVSSIASAATGGRVQAAIASAAQSSGVDFNYLLQQARIESGFNTDARARTSSATGLYQFIEQSWLSVVKKHGDEHGLSWAADAIQRGADGRMQVSDPSTRQAILDLRRNPEVSAAMAGSYAADNQNLLQSRLGRQVESVDLYLAHFLGPGGASKFLQNMDADPTQSAAALFPAAARSNHNVFFDRSGAARSLSEVRDRFATKFEGGAAVPTNTNRTWRPMQLASLNTQSSATDATTDQRMPAAANVRLAYLMLASLGV